MLGDATGEAALERRIQDNLPVSSDLVLGPCIGRGSFGQVYHGKWKGAAVAIKVLQHSGLGTISNNRVSNEAMFAKHAIHPHIVPYFDKLTRKTSDSTLPGKQQAKEQVEAETQSETLLIMEICDKGSLDDRLHQLWKLRNQGLRCCLLTVVSCLLDVAYGMEYLHSNDIQHGDLKPANILCRASSRSKRGYICKICDFGLASAFHTIDNAYTSGKGALLYASPSRLRGGSVTQEDDVYAFGILAWHLIDGDSPQARMPQLQLVHQVLSNDWRPDFSSEIPDDYRAMVESAWAISPNDRPSFRELRSILTDLSDAYSVV